MYNILRLSIELVKRCSQQIFKLVKKVFFYFGKRFTTCRTFNINDPGLVKRIRNVLKPAVVFTLLSEWDWFFKSSSLCRRLCLFVYLFAVMDSGPSGNHMLSESLQKTRLI